MYYKDSHCLRSTPTDVNVNIWRKYILAYDVVDSLVPGYRPKTIPSMRLWLPDQSKQILNPQSDWDGINILHPHLPHQVWRRSSTSRMHELNQIEWQTMFNHTLMLAIKPRSNQKPFRSCGQSLSQIVGKSIELFGFWTVNILVLRLLLLWV